MDPIQPSKKEYDECAIYGICSVNPASFFMQEIILIYLETLAFYLLELIEHGLRNNYIMKDIIDALSGPSTNVEYNQTNLNKLISKLFDDLSQAQKIYKSICTEKGIAPKYLKTSIKLANNFNLASALKQGQKIVNKRNEALNENQKNMLNVLVHILKSICLYIVELQELNVNVDDAYKELMTALNKMNLDIITDEKFEELIERAVRFDNELMHKTFVARKEEFGDITPTEVPFSTRPGKAILVSGANMKELELILKMTQDKGIDVYTHGQMIVGHTFPKIKAYPHLVGHYGKGVEYCMSDFSSFPGSIFLSKLALYNIGHLYHGRIFTSDKLAQQGVTTLNENDFEPLIRSAHLAEGFTEAETKENVQVGFYEENFFKRIHEIADKIESKEIKHLIAIGISDNTESQKKYFEKFLNLMEDDCYAISASYTNNRGNVLPVNIDYVFPFAYKTIEILAQRNLFADLSTTSFYTHCEPHTIPNLFMMKYVGMKNIYFDTCPTNLLNPALIESIRGVLNLKHYTEPEQDMAEILSN